MGFAFFGLICGCCGAASILMVASGLLRLAIFATNKIVGPAKAKAPGRIAEWDWDDWDDEITEPVPPWRAGRAIPEAGTFKCMGIVFLTALAFGLGYVLMAFAAQDIGFRVHRDETKLALVVLNIPVAGLALTVLLAWLLPTGARQAAQVAFVYGLIILAFFALVGAFVFVVATLFR